MYNTHSCSYTCIMNLKYAFVILVLRRPSVPATERRGDEVSRRQNDWRQRVPAMQWLARKCPRDEMAATKCPRDEMASDETAATKRRRRKGVYPELALFQTENQRLDLKVIG